MQYIGSRYVPKIYENSLDPSSPEWESGKTWEPFVIVTYNLDAYISKKPIPASVGNPAANPTYWTAFGFYNGQIASLNSRVTLLENHESHCFATIDDVADVEEGDLVLTRGYYTAGDGGGDLYVVVNGNDARPTVQNAGGIYLMILSDPVNIKALGCKLDDISFNCAPILNSMFTTWPNANYYAPYEDLYITDPVVIPATFKGGIEFTGRIIVPSNTGRAAIQIEAFEANKLYFKGVYGSGEAGSIGILMGGSNLSYYVGNNTLENGLINGFDTGLKIEASNGYGVMNNKYYLCRIDNCNVGIAIETIGNSISDGFISQSQFYNVWITGDGNNTKVGIKFIDNTPDHSADYNEMNFFNLSAEGCATVVEGDGFNACTFENIRLNELGPMNLATLFNLDAGAKNNKFTSEAYYVRYSNITDAGEGNRYMFNFYDPATQHYLGNEATFKNGLFCLKGECVTIKKYNVGNGITDKVIEPFKSVSVLNISRTDATTLEVTLPNNAKVSGYAPDFILKLGSIGNAIHIKTVDGAIVASTDGAGGDSIAANHVYYVIANYQGNISFTEIV